MAGLTFSPRIVRRASPTFLVERPKRKVGEDEAVHVLRPARIGPDNPDRGIGPCPGDRYRHISQFGKEVTEIGSVSSVADTVGFSLSKVADHLFLHAASEERGDGVPCLLPVITCPFII